VNTRTRLWDSITHTHSLQHLKQTTLITFSLSRSKTTTTILPKFPFTHNTQVGFIHHKFLNNSTHLQRFLTCIISTIIQFWIPPSHLPKYTKPLSNNNLVPPLLPTNESSCMHKFRQTHYCLYTRNSSYLNPITQLKQIIKHISILELNWELTIFIKYQSLVKSVRGLAEGCSSCL
jgi:hypothetical protein